MVLIFTDSETGQNNIVNFREEINNDLDTRKPIVYSMSLMTINLALLIAFDETDYDPGFCNFIDGFRLGPILDDDHWTVNYVAHPLMGSETYLRAREGNFGRFGSFLFSTAMSFTWEFVFESSFLSLYMVEPELQAKIKKEGINTLDPVIDFGNHFDRIAMAALK